jgi:hypothetical protein
MLSIHQVNSIVVIPLSGQRYKHVGLGRLQCLLVELSDCSFNGLKGGALA